MDNFENRIKSGSRHFVDFPVEAAFFDDFSDHLENLEGLEIIEFSVDGIIEMEIQFEFRGHRFFVDNYLGDYRFVAEDPNCPESILLEIIDHFQKLLEQ